MRKVTEAFRSVEVYDEQRKEWRMFEVPMLPDSTLDVTFHVQCGNGLHQCWAYMKVCSCGRVRRG